MVRNTPIDVFGDVMTITIEELLARMLVISEGRYDDELQCPTGTGEAMVACLRCECNTMQPIYSTATQIELPDALSDH